jgi:membrane protein YdbS with pleckstrin-like domain
VKGMANTSFVPHPDVKKIWFIEWIIFFVIFYLAPIIPLLFTHQLITSLIVSMCLLPIFLWVLIWFPKFYKTLKFKVKEDYLHLESGVWWRRTKSIPLQMITDIKASQGPLLRKYELGNLSIQTAGMGAQNQAEGVMTGMTDYLSLQSALLENVRLTRQFLEKTKMNGEKQDIPSDISYVPGEMITLLRSIDDQLKRKLK